MYSAGVGDKAAVDAILPTPTPFRCRRTAAADFVLSKGDNRGRTTIHLLEYTEMWIQCWTKGAWQSVNNIGMLSNATIRLLIGIGNNFKTIAIVRSKFTVSLADHVLRNHHFASRLAERPAGRAAGRPQTGAASLLHPLGCKRKGKEENVFF